MGWRPQFLWRHRFKTTYQEIRKISRTRIRTMTAMLYLFGVDKAVERTVLFGELRGAVAKGGEIVGVDRSSAKVQ